MGKIDGELFQQMVVIALDGEGVRGPALSDGIASELTLGEQGLGAARFAAKLDGVQQRDRCFACIRRLRLVASFYR